jgi:ribose transport system ATP-binding protein
MSKVLLETVGLCKHFGDNKAVDGLSIRFRAGRVHTILGENGCGKSTTLKMLAGVHPPTFGSILRNGKNVEFKSPRDSRDNGIAIIFQELSLCNNLTVAENIFANNEPHRFGVIDSKKIISDAEGILNKYHIPISAEIKVGSLSMAQRQLVEIAKGLSYPSDVVIFDEPTSSLSDSEVEILFNIISELKSENKAIIYVSHKMAEIMRISDDITVMRDGQYIDTVDKAETSIDPLITMMVGREMSDIYPSKNESTSEIGDLVLSVKSLTNPNAFHNVSFDLHAGEVVGFFGLVGAGRSDVMNALFGMLPYEGEILIKGKKVAIETPIIAIENGIAFVTENRKEEGLVLDHSVHINCNLASFERIATRGLINERAEVSQTEDSIKRMNIRVQNRHQSVGSLSGGNQQKIVLAKWLERQPDILILDEPTRGVDVGAKYEIYSIIRELTEKGTAVILVSSELPEVMNMSDRLFVMREKKLVKEFKTKGLTQDKVMVYATGVDSND